MEQKECRQCKEVKPASQYYPRPTHFDGLDSYCKECVKINSKQSLLDNKVNWWHEDGFLSEKDHFNHAIKNYAEVFNLPSLLRHIKK